MSRQIIVGNWKMNGTSRDAQALVQALVGGLPAAAPDVVVCPPFTQLALVQPTLASSPIALGAQDCHKDVSGAHTGDISPAMLTDLGVSYVILGHSERRQEHGELDETVREKAVAATKAGLTPIICIGETEDQRESGEYQDVLGWQIKGSLPDGFAGIVAYEPVWAIGTGLAATTDQIAETMAFLRAELVRQFGEAGKAIKILYGGSVNAGNAVSVLSIPEVAGALVGGASLKADAFLSIVNAASAA
ncbi:triose-phosphate isomerase [Acetobacter ghanensis]|uniref:Triosephosphate isomerase n=1 Tax=Acetobacter ghanensis TaxID=431306 RepID=A0A0U5F489_9PROT|nr:triose-phosphate isomerase [Acetobacter ghanensis]NHO38170.1 triose-phosphate isomerase [Acetobacter ghanensis]GBQ51278.1 triosephosphate isomerase [Acetobacter ghanensis DSM 18895]CEF55950.1 triosephosphate isomerase (TIM) [Acetobacter ghanensis]